MKNLSIKPLDIILFSVLLAAGVFFTLKAIKPARDTVLVQACDETFQYTLKQEGIYTVQGALGPTTFEIKDGRVHISDSACPGKNCVHQGYSSPLVCLPNQIIITIENYGEFDALSE